MALRQAAKIAAAVMLLVVAQTAPVAAQATRTWVSGVGDDANPCSRTAPCKTFAGAISKTAAGGEISVLDPGGFGAVTITKSISIVAEGAEGGILGVLTNGVIVNAGPTDVVYLRGLTLEGAGQGVNGVRFLAGAALHISNCLIRGFTSGAAAIDIETASGLSRTFISDSTITNNVAGIFVKPVSPGSAAVFLTRVIIDRNTSFGIRAEQNSLVRMDDVSITGHSVGLQPVGNGQIISFGNNAVSGNGANGAPTSTVPLI